MTLQLMRVADDDDGQDAVTSACAHRGQRVGGGNLMSSLLGPSIFIGSCPLLETDTDQKKALVTEFLI